MIESAKERERIFNRIFPFPKPQVIEVFQDEPDLELEGWKLVEGINKLIGGSKFSQVMADKLHERIRQATRRS